jgi:hypothetical protein
VSEQALPPDPSSWPEDPFLLLGVEPGVSPRELRRAYLNLIRRYKPEHAPEQFRRIREAYEVAERFIKVFGGTTPDTTQAGPAMGDEHEDGRGPELVHEAVHAVDPVRPGSEPPTPTSSPWERACEGESAEAYRALVDQVDHGPPRQDVFVQLYWLLTLTPDLDPGTRPIEWLVRGLRACPRSASRLCVLLRREAEAEPAAALDGRFLAVLAPGTHPALFLVVAACRWRAACDQGRWEIISTDLESLRAWVPTVDDAAWARVLIAAAGYLTWAEPDAFDPVEILCREIEDLGHHHLNLSDDLFQLEYARLVRSGLRRIVIRHAAVPGLYRLLSLSWNDDEGPEFRARLRTHLGQIARAPMESLKFLDHLLERSPAVLGRLEELGRGAEIGGLRGSETPDLAGISAEVEAFLAANPWWDYPTFRPRLLEFCVREMIPPGGFGGAVADRPEYVLSGIRHIAHVIADDSPLLHVYRACDLSRG